MAKQKPVSPDPTALSDLSQLPPAHQMIVKGKEAGLSNRMIGKMIDFHPVSVSRLYSTKLKKYSPLHQKRVKKAIQAHDKILDDYLHAKDTSRANYPAVSRAIDRVLDRVYPVQRTALSTQTISFTQITVNQEAVNNPAHTHIVTQPEQPATDGGQSVGGEGREERHSLPRDRAS
jgi:hypothetical protein